MKSRILIVVIGILVLASIASAEKFTFSPLAAEGASGTVDIRATQSRFGPYNTFVVIKVQGIELEPGYILEGWLLDLDSGYKLSLGAFDTNIQGRGQHKYVMPIVNAEIYDKVVISKELINDFDPNPDLPLLEATIDNSISGTTHSYVAVLQGVSSPGQGFGKFVVDTLANTVSYYVYYDGMQGNEMQSLIHGVPAPGSIGHTVHMLESGTEKAGTWHYDEDQEPTIISGHAVLDVFSDQDEELHGKLERER